jgi:hypothetical protein
MIRSGMAKLCRVHSPAAPPGYQRSGYLVRGIFRLPPQDSYELTRQSSCPPQISRTESTKSHSRSTTV